MAAAACPVALALAGRRAEAEAALGGAEGAGDAAEAFCVRAALSVAANEGEALIGGADSATVLQLVAARSDGDGVDVLASLLAPGADDGGPPEALLDARGGAALELARRYWRSQPEHPLVVRRGDAGFFAPARLGPAGGGEGAGGEEGAAAGPMSLARARALAAAGVERLQLTVPAAGLGARS
jgi:hypothetical protein